LFHIPFKKIIPYFKKIIIYNQLNPFEPEIIDCDQNLDKAKSNLSLFFPLMRQIKPHEKKEFQKFCGFFSVLPKKNLFLFVVADLIKAEKILILNFYSFESTNENEEIKNLISKIMKDFRKAFSKLDKTISNLSVQNDFLEKQEI